MKKFKLGKSKSKSKSTSEDDPNSLGLKKPGGGSSSSSSSSSPARRTTSNSNSTTSLDPKHSVDNLLEKWERNSGNNDDVDDDEDMNNNEPKQEIFMGTRRLTVTNIEKIKGQMKELHMKDGKYIPPISEDGGDLKQPAASSSSPTAAAAAPLFVDTTTSSSVDAADNENDDSSIISPFESDKAAATSTIDDQQPLELNRDNVDKVLDEVRPYLISDGGNVAVHNVDSDTGNVYLVLEGACGSCASSTVTMQMGIERVLKEKFEERLGEVIQVDPDNEDGDGDGKPTELTMEAVQVEVKRISQAITAMGGVVRVVSVDPIGVVEIEFRGPNKVKKGLELALLDVDYVKHVKFVS